MGCQAIVFGRIILRGNHEAAVGRIHDASKYAGNWYLRPEMFSVGSRERYYDDLVIAFAATYKLGDHRWYGLLIEFEHVLRDINFESAQLEVQSEYLETAHYYWRSRAMIIESDLINYRLTAKWGFGTGRRDMWGHLLEDLDSKVNREFNYARFTYPIQFNPAAVNAYNQLVDRQHRNIQNLQIANDNPLLTGDADADLFDLLGLLRLTRKLDYTYGLDNGHYGWTVTPLQQLEYFNGTAQDYLLW